MISNEELTQVYSYLDRNGLSEAVITQLRAHFPKHHFTYCMEDDINAGKPVVSNAQYAVYLVDSSEHCSKLTSALDSASGYVIAEIVAD